jgi:hypothetical protein
MACKPFSVSFTRCPKSLRVYPIAESGDTIATSATF